LFGANNESTPLYFVMLGGLCMIAAAICTQFVDDHGASEVPASVGSEPGATPYVAGRGKETESVTLPVF
jgi:hypothetical protein